MSTVSIELDTAALARLLERVEAGDEIVLDHQGQPVARIARPDGPKRKRRPGRLKGKIELDDSFFDPLPEEELEAWGQ